MANDTFFDWVSSTLLVVRNGTTTLAEFDFAAGVVRFPGGIKIGSDPALINPTRAAPLNPIVGVAAGYKIARGQLTNASASDTVVTGLNTVVAAIANMDDSPITDPEIATASIGDQAGAPAAGSILIKTWKTLGGTPVAATVFSKKINWIAIGT